MPPAPRVEGLVRCLSVETALVGRGEASLLPLHRDRPLLATTCEKSLTAPLSPVVGWELPGPGPPLPLCLG